MHLWKIVNEMVYAHVNMKLCDIRLLDAVLQSRTFKRIEFISGLNLFSFPFGLSGMNTAPVFTTR